MFLWHYLNGLRNIDNAKTDDSKYKVIECIKNTIGIIKNKILPKIQGIECISTLAKKNMNCNQFKYLSEDINENYIL